MSTCVYIPTKYYWIQQIKRYETEMQKEKWKILNAIHYLKLRLVDVIRVVLEAIGCAGLDWICLAQDGFQWWALVKILG